MSGPPPLIEREAPLAVLQARLDAAAQGGHVVLVAGEAGIGKTSLLRALAARHAAAGGPVWWGACDALDTPHPLAPLLDMAREARPRFAAALGGPRPALFEAVLDELRAAAQPLLVVVEDAHWADDATLDLLKFLGRRIERTHALLAVSYRDDEVGPTHPLRRVLGELPPAQRTHLAVARLSPAAVDTLARQAGRAPEGVHAATAGNAFFVTELLRDDNPTPGGVPRSVQDVVLARYARLPVRAQSLLQCVAAVPGRTERGLVDALHAPTLAELEACLASGLLMADATTLAYRHELGRVAVASTLSTPAAQALHARVLAVLAAPERGTAAARLVHHAVLAQDTAAISRWAPPAAAEATARGAHREAHAHWRLAVTEGRVADAAQQHQWLEAYFAAGGMVGRDEHCIGACQTLERLARERGDIADAAWQRSRQGQARIAQLRHAEAATLIGQALAEVQALPLSPHKLRVWYAAAWRLMIERDCDVSVRLATEGEAMARELGDQDIVDTLRTLRGIAMLFTEHDAGVALTQQAVAQHRAEGQLLQVASALSNLGSGSGELMRLPAAEAYLRETLALCRAHELDSPVDYASAWLALCRLARGDWDEAAALASQVLARSATLDMSRLMALLALGRLRTRRGDPGADAVLDEALGLAAPSQTLQRVGPTRAARAEAALARGDAAGAWAEVEAALPLAQQKRHPWFIGELAYWGWRAGATALGLGAASGAAEPYALQITGRWREAAAAWQALDCPYERARALAEGDADAQQQALAIFDTLGARPAADALRRQLREAGVRGVARGARASTRSHPLGLTAAELQVLRHLAGGLRNAEIAERLHRSVRTVDHHVASVLAKLGTGSRQDAVKRAEREGWWGEAAPSSPSAQSGQPGAAD